VIAPSSTSASRADERWSDADELPTVQESGREAPPREAEPLPRYGRYQLLRRIGRGGMAEVFLAVMEGAQGFRRRCVVKRIRPDKARSGYYSQMFVDEARITAALHHPNIVQVYEFGEIGELLFLTMEYLEGHNLGTVLDSLQMRDRLMSPLIAAHIAAQIARGLHHAHTATDAEGRPLGVIHRDMSPTNVMLLRTGEVKILDFGVAKAETSLKEGETRIGRVKGKVPYMAPEQHSGRRVDCRADLFSVGVILWEMLTGEILFAPERDGERSRRLVSGETPPPSELRPEVPAGLDAVVRRCLQRRPEDRYPSGAALADDLAQAVGDDRFDAGDVARLVEEVSSHLNEEAPDGGGEGIGPLPVYDSEQMTSPRDHRPVEWHASAAPPGAVDQRAGHDEATQPAPAPALRAPAKPWMARAVAGRRRLVALLAVLGLSLAGLAATARPPVARPPPARTWRERVSVVQIGAIPSPPPAAPSRAAARNAEALPGSKPPAGQRVAHPRPARRGGVREVARRQATPRKGAPARRGSAP
jgi:serine/threonine protein kinase